MADIVRTADTGTITWTAMVDGVDAAELTVDAVSRWVLNIETRMAFQRQGLARLLWETASAEAECFHALDHHRTPEGDAFAFAVGGRTVSDADGYVAECCICAD